MNASTYLSIRAKEEPTGAITLHYNARYTDYYLKQRLEKRRKSISVVMSSWGKKNVPIPTYKIN